MPPSKMKGRAVYAPPFGKTSSSGRKTAFVLFGIVFFALALRVFYLFQLKTTPLFGFYAADAKAYDIFALNILRGNMLFKDAVYLTPLYPFILSAIYKICTYHLVAVACFQAVIDTITAILIYKVGARASGKISVGLVASFLYAFYMAAIFYSGLMLDMTVSAFLLIATFFLLLHANENRRLWFLSGIAFGAAMLTRPNTVFLTPLIIAWAFMKNGATFKARAIRFILIIVGMLAMLMPFSVRNYVIGGDLSPFAVNGGLSFYIGNHSGATGSYMSVEGVSDSAIRQVKDAVRIAGKESGVKLSPSQASRYWFMKGLDFIAHDPGAAAILWLKKIFLFWNNAEIASNENLLFCKKFIPVLNIPLATFGLVAPFALLGIGLSVRQRQGGMVFIGMCIIFYMVSVVMFFVIARYRFPVVPLIVIAASYGINGLAAVIKERKIRDIVLYCSALALLASAVNITPAIADPCYNLHINHNNIGVSHYTNGAFYKAIDEYKRAIMLEPSYGEAYSNLGAAYCRIGMLDRAERAYRYAIAQGPAGGGPYYGLANIYTDRGRVYDAERLYREAIEREPDMVEAYNNLAYIYLGRGDVREAEALFLNILNIDPSYAKAYNNLGIIYARTGRVDEAVSFFKRAILLEPEYKDAQRNLFYAERRTRGSGKDQL